MASGSSLTLAPGGKEDELSISELISNLRTAFLPADFDNVEEVLVAREIKLKTELRALYEKIEFEKLDRMNIEEELKECKEKGKNAEERLMMKNRELEYVKRWAESLVESWKKKFEELSERVLRLENETKLFMNGDTHVGVGGNAEGQSGVGRNTEVVESRADPGVSIKVKEKKETIEIDVHGRECENNTAESSPSQRNTHRSFGEGTREFSGTPNKDAVAASANGSLELETFIGTGDSNDDECISGGTLKGKEATSQIVADNGHPSSSEAMHPKGLPTGVNDVTEMLKRKWVSGNSSCEFGKNILDGFDTDESSTSSSSSSSSSDSEFDIDKLPLNVHSNTIDKRRKTDASSVGLNS